MLNLFRIYDDYQSSILIAMILLFSIPTYLSVKGTVIQSQKYSYETHSEKSNGTFSYVHGDASFKKERSIKYINIENECVRDEISALSDKEKERFPAIGLLITTVSNESISTLISYKGLKGAPEKRHILLLNEVLFECERQTRNNLAVK